MKKLFSLPVLLLLALPLLSQSLLWEISGKNLKSPSYLYGTIHIQDKRAFGFDSIVIEKLLQCDAYAMELLLDDIPYNEMMNAMLMKDITLKDLYTVEQYNSLDSIMKSLTGQGIVLYDKMKPFFLMSQLMQMKIVSDMPEALDLFFLKTAREAGKKCLGIEEFSDQIQAIDAITLQEQANMLFDALNDTISISSFDQFDKLLQAYVDQDLEKLFEFSNDTALPPAFNDAFLVKRNVKMAKKIAKFSKKQSTFSAIGAAHLPGKQGVIELLQKKGYTLTPISFQFKPENK